MEIFMVEHNIDPIAYEALMELEKRYDRRLFDWLISMYDPSGGFYYAASARDHEGFLPDLESTAQGWGRIQGDGVKAPADLAMITASYLKERQDEGDGCFYDEQFGKDVSNAKRGRNTNYSVDLLASFGEKPLYLLPDERFEQQKKQPKSEQKAEPSNDILASEENVKKWLDSLPWDTDAYSACHNIGTFNESLYKRGYIKMVGEYLREKQNKNTGLWGEGLNYVTLSAAMKAAPSFYPKYGTGEFPNVDKMAESLVCIVEKYKADTIAMLCNPMYLLYFSRRSFGEAGYPEEVRERIGSSLAKIYRILASQLDEFRQPDGGYSYTRQGSSPISQGATVSLGKPEGDVNSLSLALDIRAFAWTMQGARASHPFADYVEEGFEKMRAAKAYPKKPLEIGCIEDFEASLDMDKWTTNGEVAVIGDPMKKGNSVLEITARPSGGTVARRTSFTGRNYKKMTFECRLMLSDCKTHELFYNSLGNTAVCWTLTKKSEGVITIAHRTGWSGYGDKIAEISENEWHSFKIEYEPRTKDDTSVKYYVDGELKCATEKYFGIGSRGPAVDHKSIEFSAFGSAEGKLYLDDIRVEIE